MAGVDERKLLLSVPVPDADLQIIRPGHQQTARVGEAEAVDTATMRLISDKYLLSINIKNYIDNYEGKT